MRWARSLEAQRRRDSAATAGVGGAATGAMVAPAAVPPLPLGGCCRCACVCGDGEGQVCVR